MKTCVIIQARVGSTRLPRKVLKQLPEGSGVTVLEQVINRVKSAKLVDEIIIATTINKIDDAIVDEAKRVDVKYFRGSEEDVLSRYYFAAKESAADVIVRITSDCPLYETDILEKMLEEFHSMDCDYLSNVVERSFPRGLDTEIFTFKVLKRCFLEATETTCREHVTPYIYGNPEKFKIANYKGERDLSNYRWTLDTQEDYKLINEIYSELYYTNKNFNMQDILNKYEIHQEWNSINLSIEQKKVGYKSL